MQEYYSGTTGHGNTIKYHNIAISCHGHVSGVKSRSFKCYKGQKCEKLHCIMVDSTSDYRGVNLSLKFD